MFFIRNQQQLGHIKIVRSTINLGRSSISFTKRKKWQTGFDLLSDSTFKVLPRMRTKCFFYRLQGIVGSMSRMPTFRRKFKNLVKVLYLEALQAGIIATTPPEGGGLKRRLSGQGSIGKAGVNHLAVNKEEILDDTQIPEDVV